MDGSTDKTELGTGPGMIGHERPGQELAEEARDGAQEAQTRCGTETPDVE